jgi:hypothetical protein
MMRHRLSGRCMIESMGLECYNNSGPLSIVFSRVHRREGLEAVRRLSYD